MVVIRIIIRGGTGGGGEANTISSLGGGTSPLTATVSKVGVDLRVKSLSVTTALSKTDVADLITLGLQNLPVLGTLPASPRQIAITNAEIIAAAGILVNKLQALTVTKDVISDGSGFLATTSRARHITKGVDETVNNSITLQDDNELFFPGLANTTYFGMIFTYFNSSAIADFKDAFSLPAGATGEWKALFSSFGNSPTTIANMLTSLNFSGSGVDVSKATYFKVRIAGTAGNIQYQWSQQTAEVSDTKVLRGSCMIIAEE